MGITEVKCPYSLRDVKMESKAEWHHHLPYLHCNNEIMKTPDFYHQMQWTMTAVVVDLCDFFRWTPRNLNVLQIYRFKGWSLREVTQLESFYKHYIVAKEDFLDGDSDKANTGYR